MKELAQRIRKAWKKVHYAAEPYLQAMEELENINDNYYCDRGDDIVRRFLCNASTFRGQEARDIKKELRSML